MDSSISHANFIMLINFFKILTATVSLFVSSGCLTVRTEHHITLEHELNHNLNISLKEEVNNFVDDLYAD